MKINEDISEKPDHLHYPACLGRKTEIEKKSFEMFVYTSVSSLFFIFLSIAGARFTVPYVLPEIICGTNDVAAAFLQSFEFLLMAVLSLIGCTRYKIADFIIFLIYVMTLAITLFAKEYLTDALIIIASIGGIYKSYGSYSMMYDYEQLRNTEGFPMFSLILAEHEEKKNNSGSDPSVYRNDSGSDQMSTALEAAAPILATVTGIADMPSVAPVHIPEHNYTEKRYMPRGSKVSGIIDSPMRTR